MQDLAVHRGGQRLTKEELDLIRVPEETDSYIPVSHYYLADKLLTISQDILRDYVLVGESYAVARNGNQMFALLKFQQDQGDMALSIAFRNSYDRSMSLGLAIGASVFVCDNLALYGDIVLMRKHTKNVWNELEDLAIATLYRSSKNFEQIVADAELLKRERLGNNEAFGLMGRLFGYGILSPRQAVTLKQKWLHPSYAEFQERNKWSFFNAVTESLKTCPPVSIMEKHVRAYGLVVKGNVAK